MARHKALRSLAAVLGCALWLAPVASFAQSDDILDNLGDAKSGSQQPRQPSAQPAKQPPAAQPRAQAQTTAVRAAPTPAAAKAASAEVVSGDVTSPASLDRIKAVPRKTLLKRHRFELAPFGTMSLNDSYYQHLAVGGEVIFYPHDAFGLGVGVDYMMTHLKLSNVETIRQNYYSVPAVFELPNMFAHVDAYFVPIYGKLSLFSSDIIHFDTYVVGGLGAAMTSAHTRPAANLGIGQRLMFGEWFAVRVELRDHMFVDTQEVDGLTRSAMQNYVMLMAGVSVFLPMSFDYSFQ